MDCQVEPHTTEVIIIVRSDLKNLLNIISEFRLKT